MGAAEHPVGEGCGRARLGAPAARYGIFPGSATGVTATLDGMQWASAVVAVAAVARVVSVATTAAVAARGSIRARVIRRPTFKIEEPKRVTLGPAKPFLQPPAGAPLGALT